MSAFKGLTDRLRAGQPADGDMEFAGTVITVYERALFERSWACMVFMACADTPRWDEDVADQLHRAVAALEAIEEKL